MLYVYHPPTYSCERSYILKVLLGEFLGLEYKTLVEDRNSIRLVLQDDTFQKEIIVKDILFQTPQNEWLTSASMPSRPLKTWDIASSLVEVGVVSPQIPVIFGDLLSNNSYYMATESGISLGLDIFGSAFFMLTRYEEAVNKERDTRERYPATASLAYQEGFLKRPIVNEYLEILWWAITKLWPELQRKKRKFHIHLSHDVDWPYCTRGLNLKSVLRSAVGDLVKRKNPSLSANRLYSFFQVKRGNLNADIGNNFDFIMDISEKQGLKSCFNFITGNTGEAIDGKYSIHDPWIRGLLRKIHKRGHEIGLHPSYNTFSDSLQTKKEFQTLLQVLEEEGITQMAWGGRQHFLRWENPTTWQIWEDVGLDYDSTLTFADNIGFRCGICYDYPTFNLRTRKSLKLREYPLIVMEGTLSGYMGLSFEKSLKEIAELRKICAFFQGNFSLLWHNSSLLSTKEKNEYYKVILEAVTNR